MGGAPALDRCPQAMNCEVDVSPDVERSIALVEQFERIGQLAEGQ